MRERGSLDLFGPSTKRAVLAVLDGELLATAGRFGATNGAAMRVTPVAIIRAWQSPDILGGISVDPFVDLVVETTLVTHNTGVAIAGAAAVAAAVSAGVDGAHLAEALAAALAAALRASACAALVITRRGPATAPTVAEVQRRFDGAD